MNFEYILKCVEDAKNMAKDIAPFIKNNIIFLNGEIGAGKTTFTKYLVEIYGLNDEVCSPTFSLENRYNTKNGLIIHFDLYRIKNEEELDMIGFYDTLKEDATILIEWADKFNIEKYIKNYKIISFKIHDSNIRYVTIK
ncbi:tRNA (adenosine(37)-N6)-threonylcarbamoyltransferase complex ATPase subunit type 1 TsaE [Mucispirillum schaedleri]|uniref:tRNA (adenosine(37)-N6)-threonylcarbamoyltransferase complex ATPase subunit type 1 TsaE n=1 Tax=Mucispirillum schaedleri TaxID=248039 RepID=UPI001F57E57E|nr:tRNA (adenosine(37)-N6)-threonylcarbamoyltransferase complex ATPase subunit type 1 TsaE [Mucispirillum schaedleri]